MPMNTHGKEYLKLGFACIHDSKACVIGRIFCTASSTLLKRVSTDDDGLRLALKDCEMNKLKSYMYGLAAPPFSPISLTD